MNRTDDDWIREQSRTMLEIEQRIQTLTMQLKTQPMTSFTQEKLKRRIYEFYEMYGDMAYAVHIYRIHCLKDGE